MSAYGKRNSSYKINGGIFTNLIIKMMKDREKDGWTNTIKKNVGKKKKNAKMERNEKIFQSLKEETKRRWG